MTDLQFNGNAFLFSLRNKFNLTIFAIHEHKNKHKKQILTAKGASTANSKKGRLMINRIIEICIEIDPSMHAIDASSI